MNVSINPARSFSGFLFNSLHRLVNLSSTRIRRAPSVVRIRGVAESVAKEIEG